MKTAILIAAVATLALTGCTRSLVKISPDFGDATRANTKAQIADPEPQYAGVPEPGSNGARAGLAQQRYVTGKVIQPSTLSASGATQDMSGKDNGGSGDANAANNGSAAAGTGQ